MAKNLRGIGLNIHTVELELGDATLVSDQHVTVATDGSHDIQGRFGTYAWISDDGRFRAGLVQGATNSLISELTAIFEAIRASKKDRITLLTDSRLSLGLLRILLDQQEAPATAREVRIARQILAAVDGKHVTLRWVKAHVGYTMNEAADTLAHAELVARRTNPDTDAYKTVKPELLRRGQKLANGIRRTRSEFALVA
ncbi:RNase H family protein [Leifsonia sp. Leaf264]|uniref:RNase H family protein n=1 Tax=Leifsonia sp. Leaf264 TaxID=1736314 RepID=UPI0006F8076E|nr:RNase H family protein [Leifsonia sp. Leaf264]KQO98212.1 hypothetical protein ASF30_09125 [Leifsonia sp. Leaf264]